MSLDLASILAQSNPQIDISTTQFDNSTHNFLKSVSRYSARAIAEMTKRRDKYHTISKKIQEQTNEVISETNRCKEREIELVEEMEREREEKREAESSAAGYRRQLAVLRDECDAIDAEITQLKLTNEALKRGKQYYRSKIVTLFLKMSLFCRTRIREINHPITRVFDPFYCLSTRESSPMYS